MEWSTMVIGLVGAGSGFIIAFLNYRRSKTVDAVSEQSGAAANHRAGTAQVIEGLNQLIDQLQEDNETFRKDLRDLGERLVIVSAERDALKLEVARLRKKFVIERRST